MEKIINTTTKECTDDSTLWFVLGENSSAGEPAKLCGDISKLWCMNTEKSQWPII